MWLSKFYGLLSAFNGIMFIWLGFVDPTTIPVAAFIETVIHPALIALPIIMMQIMMAIGVVMLGSTYTAFAASGIWFGRWPVQWWHRGLFLSMQMSILMVGTIHLIHAFTEVIRPYPWVTVAIACSQIGLMVIVSRFTSKTLPHPLK